MPSDVSFTENPDLRPPTLPTAYEMSSTVRPIDAATTNVRAERVPTQDRIRVPTPDRIRIALAATQPGDRISAFVTPVKSDITGIDFFFLPDDICAGVAACTTRPGWVPAAWIVAAFAHDLQITDMAHLAYALFLAVVVCVVACRSVSIVFPRMSPEWGKSVPYEQAPFGCASLIPSFLVSTRLVVITLEAPVFLMKDR